LTKDYQNRKLRIGGATVNQTPIDWDNNTQNIISAIEAAKKQDIDILCFPELSITSYSCEDLFLTDWVAEQAWKELETIVPICDNIFVSVGLPIRIDSITYNAACVIHNKKILGLSVKQNLPGDGVHYEPRWFTPWPIGQVKEIKRNGQSVQVGDLIYEAFGIKVGFEICEDAWTRNRPGYRLFQKDVDLILNPSASHFALGKSPSREKLVIIDGSEKFQCAYVFVNALGNEAGRMIYDGDIVIGQQGKLLAVNKRLSFKNFNILSSLVDFNDPDKSENVPFTDGKERNEEFARATSLALFDYLRKSKAKGFVLSLSGGADSSLCAVLVSEMVKRGSQQLGWEQFCRMLNLTPTSDHKTAVSQLLSCAYQGTKNSSKETFSAAKELAQSIGAKFFHWLIDEEVNSYISKIERVLERPLTWDKDDIALQNIQARSRSPIIWLLANINQAILLTTSNRSEGDVGYATMDGDTSGSLAPIAGIDKPFILQWLNWAEKNLDYKDLSFVNNLTPTAELRPAERAQTDEKDLMPYNILVEIERLAIRDRKSPREVYLQLSSQHPDTDIKIYVKKFYRLWAANQWKRERLAPSFHLDDLNVDPRSWCRFPILSGNFAKELEAIENIGNNNRVGT
jgi:NAD+ synthase (glutamine-hydrolysing)